MAADLGFKVMNAVHLILLKVTGGRVGWTALGMPVLELTTTGRRSGLPRSVMLTSPLHEGGVLVVVASRGGDDEPPAWLLNVQADPEVEVRLRDRPRQRMRARVATPAERARLWPMVTADHKNYAGYQSNTSREIALVLLEPVA